MLSRWLKTNTAPLLAVFISISAMGLASIKQETVESTQINLRVSAIEHSIEPLIRVPTELQVLQVKMQGITGNIGEVSSALAGLTTRTNQLETSLAVANTLTTELTRAVTDLSESTKKLTGVMTNIAVLDEKVQTLTKAINDRN